METLRFELYQNLISLFSNYTETDLEAKVVDYLSSLENYKNLELLKNHSNKLQKLKGS